VIRDAVRRFDETEYQTALHQMTNWALTGGAAKKVKTIRANRISITFFIVPTPSWLIKRLPFMEPLFDFSPGKRLNQL
jgi:hypothetical protein